MTVYSRIPGLRLSGPWVAVDYLLGAGLLQAGTLTKHRISGLIAGRGLLLLVMPILQSATRTVARAAGVLILQILLGLALTLRPEPSPE